MGGYLTFRILGVLQNHSQALQPLPPKPDLNGKSFTDFFNRERFEMGAGLN